MNIKFIPAALAIVFCTLASWGKVNITHNDYQLAEVITNGVNIRTGPGTNYPKAYTEFVTEWDGQHYKTDVPQAYKGNRYFVKDAGDWWEIETPGTLADGYSPQFILKKFAKVLETEVFDMESMTAPQVWGKAEPVQYEDEKGMELTIVTIYPEGLVVTQYYGIEGDELHIGEINDDKGAILYLLAPWFTFYGDEQPSNAPLKLWADPGSTPPSIYYQFGKNKRSYFTYKGKKYDYLDISVYPESQWNEMKKTLSQSPDIGNITLSNNDPESYILRSDLSGFVRIK